MIRTERAPSGLWSSMSFYECENSTDDYAGAMLALRAHITPSQSRCFSS